MKKTMKCLIAVFIMAMAFVVTGFTSEAYGVDQVAASKNAATIQWDQDTSSYLQGWLVYMDGAAVAQLPATQTSYQFTGLAQGQPYVVQVISVYNYGGSTGIKYYEEGDLVVRTTPGKVGKIYINWSQRNQIEMAAADPDMFMDASGKNYLYNDGYKVVIKDYKNKVRKTMEVDAKPYYGGFHHNFTAMSSIKDRGMTYSITPYITLDNGTKVYGSTVSKVAVPMARIKGGKATGNSTAKITWNKVKGAKNYTVYMKKEGAKKWKKVGTTSKTSMTLKKLIKRQDYLVYVQANKVKIGKKKYNTTKFTNMDDLAYGFYIYTTYR